MNETIHPLEYRPPSEAEIVRMQTFNRLLKAAYDYALGYARLDRERQLCLMKLEEARMWFNAATVKERG